MPVDLREAPAFADVRAAYRACKLCPRACGVDRTRGERGICGASAQVRIGRAALHWWEEPCLVGERGSGAVFFSHCPLGCVYCQNRSLVEGAGVAVSDDHLAEVFLRLQNDEHAANINLVTPTHYTPTIASVLAPLRASGALHIPVVYNTSSFDAPAALALMDGLIDVYLADFKYVSRTLARRLSHARTYPDDACRAIDEMVRQVPAWEMGDDDLLRRGVIVRHLVLPGHIDESLRVLDFLWARYGPTVRLSIMNQYTPLEGNLAHFGLDGVVSSEEYERVLDYADDLGIEDYFWQEGGAATESFIPVFDGTGV